MTVVEWNIGSVTKTFVAVVVLQLADEGKIDLDAGIDRFLPDLADADRITPRRFLQHTSGLGEYNDNPAVLNDPHRVWSPSELIAVAVMTNTALAGPQAFMALETLIVVNEAG